MGSGSGGVAYLNGPWQCSYWRLKGVHPLPLSRVCLSVCPHINLAKIGQQRTLHDGPRVSGARAKYIPTLKCTEESLNRKMKHASCPAHNSSVLGFSTHLIKQNGSLRCLLLTTEAPDCLRSGPTLRNLQLSRLFYAIHRTASKV
jgi:hypothetical protein